MRKFIIFLLAISALFLCSCSMESETHIKKDGSGSSEFTMDMGGMIEMMGGMGGMMGEELGMGDDEETSKKDDFRADDFMKLMESEEKIDSSVNMYAVMPDSLKGSELAEVLKKVNLRVQSDKAAGISKFTIKMDYDDEAEYEKINAALASMENESEDEDMGKKTPKLDDLMSIPQVDRKKGIVIIPATDWNEMMGDDLPGGGMGGMGLGGGGEEDEENSETDAMMAMMFGDSGLKNTYHLPGKIEFTSDATAVINGNSVTFNIPMAEFMDNMKTPRYVIKYKP